jgi:hypothetical protein
MPTLTARADVSSPNFLTHLYTVAAHALQANEPTEAGGQDQGPSPGELVSADYRAVAADEAAFVDVARADILDGGNYSVINRLLSELATTY